MKTSQRPKRIRFQGAEYLFVGSDLSHGGPIATEEEYTTFKESFAWLSPTGRVYRHNRQIGAREDIEVLGESDVVPTPEGMAEGLAFLDRFFR